MANKREMRLFLYWILMKISFLLLFLVLFFKQYIKTWISKDFLSGSVLHVCLNHNAFWYKFYILVAWKVFFSEGFVKVSLICTFPGHLQHGIKIIQLDNKNRFSTEYFAIGHLIIYYNNVFRSFILNSELQKNRGNYHRPIFGPK